MQPKNTTFEGKTLEDAVRKGLDALGLNRAEVTITVMEEGSGGFLGFGARPFRVRMMPRPGGAPRDVDDRGGESASRGGDRGGRGGERGGRGGERGGRGGERGGRGGERGGRGGERGGESAGRGGERGGRGGREAVRAEAPRSGDRPDRGGSSGRGGAPVAARPEREVRAPRVERTDQRPPREAREPREARGERTDARPPREPRAGRQDSRPPRPPRGDRPAERAPADELQPGTGARGFEDRRRPGDRRDDDSAPLTGDDRRTGGDRRNLTPGMPENNEANDAGGEGDHRRRRRGRRGGRGRRRGPGAGNLPANESGLMAAGPAPAEAMTSMMPTEHEQPVAHEPEMHTDDTSDWGAPASATPAPPHVEPSRPIEHGAHHEHAGRRDRHEREESTMSEGPVLSSEELQSVSLRVTEELLQAMGFEGKVTATVNGDTVDVVAEVGEGEDLLTGRKGETRQALQHLLNRMVNKGEGSRYHLQLEINDFWKHRELELADLARKLADDAVSTGTEQVTEFLNAAERRIIHVTLREDGRVKTHSVGDGMIKRLAVAPAHSAETSGAES